MKQRTIWAVGFVWFLVLGLTGCASQGTMSDTSPARFSDGVLVSRDGMTLYTFDKDSPGKSACYGVCAANWPPLTATASDRGEGKFSIITRDDGTKQWAYEGKPLYRFVQDQKPGDEKGDGVKGVWHVLKGQAAPSSPGGMYRY